jgi:hypothetical protein
VTIRPSTVLRVTAVVGPLVLLLVVVAIASRAGRPEGAATPVEPEPSPIGDYVLTVLLTLTALFLVALLIALVTIRTDEWRDPGRHWIRDFFLFLAFIAVFGWFALQFQEWIERANELRDTEAASPTQTIDPREQLQPYEPERPARFQWPAAIAVVSVVALVVAAAVILERRRLVTRGAVPHVSLASELAEVLAATIEDVRREPDPRRAVIAAYAQMERVVAERGLPRRPAEAPFEYLARILRELRVRAAAVLALTELFERARFSHHAIDQSMKEEAIDALVAVRDDLQAATA